MKDNKYFTFCVLDIISIIFILFLTFTNDFVVFSYGVFCLGILNIMLYKDLKGYKKSLKIKNGDDICQ